MRRILDCCQKDRYLTADMRIHIRNWSCLRFEFHVFVDFGERQYLRQRLNLQIRLWPFEYSQQPRTIFLAHEPFNLRLVLRHEDVLTQRIQFAIKVKLFASVVAFGGLPKGLRRSRKDSRWRLDHESRVPIHYTRPKRRDMSKVHLPMSGCVDHCYMADTAILEDDREVWRQDCR